MGVKLAYEKDGQNRVDNFSSYYEAVKKKNRLLKKGITAQLTESREKALPRSVIEFWERKPIGKKVNKEQTRQLIQDFIQRAKINYD